MGLSPNEHNFRRREVFEQPSWRLVELKLHSVTLVWNRLVDVAHGMEGMARLEE
jgi:hypothetical protein